MISLIYDLIREENQITVYAIIEDIILTHNQTQYDPPEYGPGLCKASFTLSEDDELPENDYDLVRFIENLDLNWELEDNSYDYID
jgi:hypothetical protein